MKLIPGTVSGQKARKERDQKGEWSYKKKQQRKMIKLSHCYYHNSTQEQLNLTAQSQEHNLVDGERDTRKVQRHTKQK